VSAINWPSINSADYFLSALIKRQFLPHTHKRAYREIILFEKRYTAEKYSKTKKCSIFCVGLEAAKKEKFGLYLF